MLKRLWISWCVPLESSLQGYEARRGLVFEVSAVEAGNEIENERQNNGFAKVKH
jgi:hypothetical protein